jgi:hypothetical protein
VLLLRCAGGSLVGWILGYYAIVIIFFSCLFLSIFSTSIILYRKVVLKIPY